MICLSGQMFSLPVLQAEQLPHETRGLIVTRSPSRAPPQIIPAASWPSISGAGRLSS